jgi:hypothetical protein
MADTNSDPGPWARLQKAAYEAMDKLMADYSRVSDGKWEDDDAMQIYENLFGATEDIEKAKVNADTLPNLLAEVTLFADIARIESPDTRLGGWDWKGIHERLTALLAKAHTTGTG